MNLAPNLVEIPPNQRYRGGKDTTDLAKTSESFRECYALWAGGRYCTDLILCRLLRADAKR
jgi:hypothetical protein